MRKQPPPPFQSYLDDLNSSTNCCRSASLLVPANNANEILQTLRCRGWLCLSVLTHQWRKHECANINNDVQYHLDNHEGDSSWYFQCLPSEDELTLLNKRYSPLPYMAPSSSSSLQEQTVKYHLQCNSLLVPLTGDATEILLRACFEASLFDDTEGAELVRSWLQFHGIMIVHNCDGNQTVSLCKERDCFPESVETAQSDNAFTFVDLFAGIGGFRLGMESLGGKCIGSCEIDAYARETYRNNFQVHGEFFVNDITRLEIFPSTVDVLCGGFPCQSFSTMASFSSSSERGGLRTPTKGKLFFHLLRILRKARPKMFVLENVKGLVSLDNGCHFQRILQLLEESGYRVTHGVVDTAWFLPQRRERVYFVGVRCDLFSYDDGRDYVAFTPKELKDKYQIYANDLDQSVDKYERLLQKLNLQEEDNSLHSSSTNLPKSKVGDVLEPDAKIPSYCFLSMHQWQKIQSKSYLQLHNDGAGRLITADEPCSATIVSSYRQSYLLHSQFIVSRNNAYLAYQQQKLRNVALVKTKAETAMIDDVAIHEVTPMIEEQLPRFFSPREWLVPNLLKIICLVLPLSFVR